MDRTRLRMLKELMALDFTTLELNLYLDTHPDDRLALDTYNDYVRRANRLRSDYEDRYGPLTSRQPSGFPYEYIRDPWPWEIKY